MSTVAILLSAFLLSVIALGFFIWSQRAGLLDRNSNGAEVIFATGEIRSALAGTTWASRLTPTDIRLRRHTSTEVLRLVRLAEDHRS